MRNTSEVRTVTQPKFNVTQANLIENTAEGKARGGRTNPANTQTARNTGQTPGNTSSALRNTSKALTVTQAESHVTQAKPEVAQAGRLIGTR